MLLITTEPSRQPFHSLGDSYSSDSQLGQFGFPKKKIDKVHSIVTISQARILASRKERGRCDAQFSGEWYSQQTAAHLACYRHPGKLKGDSSSFIFRTSCFCIYLLILQYFFL